jgi:hypothetical protein
MSNSSSPISAQSDSSNSSSAKSDESSETEYRDSDYLYEDDDKVPTLHYDCDNAIACC